MLDNWFEQGDGSRDAQETQTTGRKTTYSFSRHTALTNDRNHLVNYQKI